MLSKKSNTLISDLMSHLADEEVPALIILDSDLKLVMVQNFTNNEGEDLRLLKMAIDTKENVAPEIEYMKSSKDIN